MTRHQLAALACLALAMVVSEANAQQRTDGWYAGGSLGQGRVDVGGGTTSPSAGVSTSKKDNDTFYKLFGGYRFGRHFAAEGGYADFGKYSLDLSRAAPAGNAHAGIKVTGWFIDAVGIIPIANNFAFFGKLGAVRTTVKSDVSASGSLVLRAGVSPNAKQTENDWKWGVGASYDFAPNVGARIEYERLKNVEDNTGGSSDIKLWSVGLVYRF